MAPLFFFFGRCSNKAKCCAFFEHFSVCKGILSIFNGRVWFFHWNCQWDECCGWLIIWAVALWICGCLKLWFILIDGILLLWRKAVDVWVVVMCISSHHLPRVVVYSCRRDSSLKKGDRRMSCTDWCISPHFSSGCKFQVAGGFSIINVNKTRNSTSPLHGASPRAARRSRASPRVTRSI